MQTESIPNLVPESRAADIVTPDTPVICINRGRQTFTQKMFDGEPYTIPPGKFIVQMRVGKHFRSRLPVMGTRNREDFTELSHIAILGTVGGTVAHDEGLGFDPPEKCVPFTDEELEAFGEPKEALQRAPGEIRYVETRGVASQLGFQAEGRTKNIGAFVGDQQVPASEVLAKSDEPNAAAADGAAARAEGVAPSGSGAPDASIKGTGGGKSLKSVKQGMKG